MEKVLAFTAAGGATGAETIANLQAVVAGNAKGEEGVKELADMEALFDAGGYEGRVKIDPSVVRGLEYYTGPVFEAELLFDVTNEDGQKVVFGSVGGGGRYDGLVSRFRGEPVPATGFSIGVSRLMTALKTSASLMCPTWLARSSCWSWTRMRRAWVAIRRWFLSCVRQASALKCMSAVPA